MKKIIPFLLFAASAYAQNNFSVPVNFLTGSTITITAGVPLYGTWDFTGATTVTLPSSAWQTITLNGNVTGSGTSAITTTVATIPDLVSAPGSILSTNISSPTIPTSGKTKWFTDSTDKRFHDRNDTGSTGTTVVANTGATHKFVTAISASGAVTIGQPDFSDLSGTAVSTQGGVTTGGATGQVLSKLSASNYDTAWIYKGGVASVTSTVDQTATTETAHVSYTIPANSAAIGRVYHIHASGNVDNNTTAITFTPRIRWGGTGGVSLLAIPTFAASTTPNTNRAYVLDGYVTVRTTGATGTAVAEMRYSERSTSTTGVETVHEDNSGTTAVTIDTTANKDLDLTWTLSDTTGAPHIRTISGYVSVEK